MRAFYISYFLTNNLFALLFRLSLDYHFCCSFLVICVVYLGFRVLTYYSLNNNFQYTIYKTMHVIPA